MWNELFTYFILKGDMLTWFLIESTIALTLLYIPYTLILRKERFFRQNRLTLLAILILSLALPFCNFHALYPGGLLERISLPEPIPVVESQPMGLSAPNVSEHVAFTELANDAVSSLAVMAYLCILYIIGVLVVLTVRLWQFIRMDRLICRGCLWHDTIDGITIYCHSSNIAPYSWMRHIVISQHDYDSHRHEILLHERGHVLCCHSWDILLLMLVQTVQWFNPFVYMLGASLRDIHEYEADDYVLRQGITASEYQTLLLNTAVSNSVYAFANNFNHSQIKNRIVMMKNKKSNPWARCKALYIFPLAILLLSSFATPKDNCQLCVLYTQLIRTTDRNDVTVTDSIYSILEIGEVISKYGDVSDYSLLKNHLPEGKHTERIKFEDCRIDANLWVYHNYPHVGTLTVHEALHPSRIYYEESTKMQQWALLPGDTVILGYNCRRAHMSYGGRVWTAWYAEEIPVSSGPWKLCGLPGLVLHASDQSGTHTFSAYTIFNVEEQPIKPHSHYTANKVNRDKFIKTRNKIKTDPQWIIRPWYNDENNAFFAVLDEKDRERLNIPYFISINGVKYPDFQFLYHYQPLELK